MRPFSLLVLIAATAPLAVGGCTSKRQSSVPAAETTAASPAGGGTATTTRDPRFKSDPNVPDYIKRQAGGGGARSGPAQ